MTHESLLRGASGSALVAALSLGAATAAYADATPQCNDGAVVRAATECGSISAALADGATAVGVGAYVDPTSTQGTAVGTTSYIQNRHGVVLGTGTFALGSTPGSVALGAFSVASSMVKTQSGS